MAAMKQPVTTWTPTPSVTIPFDVYIQQDVFIKLQEYARAAIPKEIGGLARVERHGDRDVIVTDIAMLEQDATGGSFEIDAEQVNKFITELVQAGRMDEVPDWCSIVHSHPEGMTPAMSGVDIDNITTLADDQHFFSLIITADKDGESQRICMHYAQRTPFGDWMVLNELEVRVAHPSWREVLRKEVEEEVKKLIKPSKHLPVRHRQGSLLGVGASHGTWWDIDEHIPPPTPYDRSDEPYGFYNMEDADILANCDLEAMDSYEQSAFLEELDDRMLTDQFVNAWILRESDGDNARQKELNDAVNRAKHWHSSDYGSGGDHQRKVSGGNRKKKKKKNSNTSKKEKQA